MKFAQIGAGPYPRATRIVALTILFVSVTAMWVNIFHVYQTDFISYWAASVLTLGGDPAAAYDVEVHRAVQTKLVEFDGLMPFPYPPPFLILLLPFGLLPYPVAAAFWIIATAAAYFAIGRRVWPGSGVLLAAFPAVLANGIIGQNGFLTAALFIGGLALVGKRPFVAGLMLGCLVFKPQLGILLPVAFLAARQWRAFAGAAISSLGLLLLGLAAFGLEPYAAMVDIMPLYGSIASEGRVGWHKMASVYASLRLAGMPADFAWLAHVAVAFAATFFLWRTWRSDCALEVKGATLAAATFLISPYLYFYDSLILVVPFFSLLAAGANKPLLAMLWCIPFISIGQSWGLNETVNLMPVVPIGLLILIQRQHRFTLWRSPRAIGAPLRAQELQ